MSNVRIEIVSSDFRPMKGVGKTSGKAYDMALQDAYLHTGAAYPDKFELQLKKDEVHGYRGYSPGWYVPSASSYQVRDSRLSINSFELVLEPAHSDVAAKKLAVA